MGRRMVQPAERGAVSAAGCETTRRARTELSRVQVEGFRGRTAERRACRPGNRLPRAPRFPRGGLLGCLVGAWYGRRPVARRDAALWAPARGTDRQGRPARRD